MGNTLVVDKFNYRVATISVLYRICAASILIRNTSVRGSSIFDFANNCINGPYNLAVLAIPAAASGPVRALYRYFPQSAIAATGIEITAITAMSRSSIWHKTSRDNLSDRSRSILDSQAIINSKPCVRLWPNYEAHDWRLSVAPGASHCGAVGRPLLAEPRSLI